MTGWGGGEKEKEEGARGDGRRGEEKGEEREEEEEDREARRETVINCFEL